jgi:hypothetical protein
VGREVDRVAEGDLVGRMLAAPHPTSANEAPTASAADSTRRADRRLGPGTKAPPTSGPQTMRRLVSYSTGTTHAHSATGGGALGARRRVRPLPQNPSTVPRYAPPASVTVRGRVHESSLPGGATATRTRGWANRRSSPCGAADAGWTSHRPLSSPRRDQPGRVMRRARHIERRGKRRRPRLGHRVASVCFCVAGRSRVGRAFLRLPLWAGCLAGTTGK